MNQIDVNSLPSVLLQSYRTLPNTSGIYFAIDGQGTIQYIGKTVNLKGRWSGHHRYSQLEEMSSVRIAYLETEKDLLDSVEIALIEWFKPPLNESFPSNIKGVKRRRCESITLSVPPEEKAELEAIALKFGLTWGDKPNISALVKAIASHALKVDWNDETQKRQFNQVRALAAIAKIKEGLDELGGSL